jgi:hypothetical protein
MSALGANRTRRDDGNDVNDPLRTSRVQFNPIQLHDGQLTPVVQSIILRIGSEPPRTLWTANQS